MEVASQASKRKRDFSDYDNGEEVSAATTGGEVDLSLLEALEKSQQNPVEALDLKTLKRLVLAFERRLKDNTAARLKYPDQPEKFADSEVELHEEIEKLKILAGGPELYPELVSLGTVASITQLLNHDNTDIAIDAVSLVQDLTDEDVFDGEDNDEQANVLVDTLIENNALELLVQNLSRLSESDPDESAAIYSILSTVENLIEIKPSVAELVCERTKLMKWLVGKIKVREFDSNKQYASEILAILLQNSTANQKRLGQMNGVDAVLQAVAMYKSRDPKTGDEEEMVENLFDCLCCLLMPLENKEKFVKAEGVELMIIIMNQKKLSYGSAIRALDFAMTNYPPACERFIDVMGLKTAFPAFMGKIPVSKKNKKKGFKEEIEERLISLIASLFGGILRGSRRERLLSKFVENECEKIDRLMELYMRYSNRVKAETERLNDLELDDLEMDEEEKYNRKLDSGLYTLQLIAVILGHLWTSEHPRMRARIELLLKQNKLSRKDVKDVLQLPNTSWNFPINCEVDFAEAQSLKHALRAATAPSSDAEGDENVQLLAKSNGPRMSRKERNPKRLSSSASQKAVLDHFQIVKYSLITDLTMREMLENNTLTFVVDKHADKKNIKAAVKKMFKIQTKKVNTLIMPDGNKKAYLMLMPNHNALEVAKKIKII